MQNLLKKRYIIRDVANRREPREYAQKILRIARDVKINVNNQLNHIYNDIDMKVRVDDLRRLKENIILNTYLKKLDEFKYDWWKKSSKALRDIQSQRTQFTNR